MAELADALDSGNATSVQGIKIKKFKFSDS